MKHTRLAAVVLALSASAPRPAEAALTASEKAVVRTFVVKGALDTAGRVRALVARPDLTAEEISEPLRAGYAASPFDDAHRRFTEALLFGPGSSASRTALVPAVVEGLLARATARMSDVPLTATTRVSPKARDAADEVLAIHAFVDARIANGGNPPPNGHDGALAIRDDALLICARLYKEHLAANERALNPPGRAASELVKVRAQAELALIDLARGIASRHEVAEWLGLRGARKATFERASVLVEADASAPEAKVAAALGMLESVPHATDGLELWILSKTSPAGLSAHGAIARAGVVLSDEPRPLPPGALWPPGVKPSSPDAAVAGVAASVAELATARALAASPALAARLPGAAARAARASGAGYLAADVLDMPLSSPSGRVAPSPEAVLRGAVRLLLLDGARALELALIRAGEGHAEPLEQLALGLGVLAADGPVATVGRTRDDGAVEPVPVTDVKTAGGVATAFTLAGKRHLLTDGADGALTVTVDGAAPKLASLGAFQVLPRAGETWRVDGLSLARLQGEPRAVALDDGRFVVEGGKGGFDAISAGEEFRDTEISATIRPSGTGGGLLARAAPGQGSYAGIALWLQTDSGQARLLMLDGHGKATPLAEAMDLPNVPPEGFAVSLKVAGDRVTAQVGSASLAGTLPGGVPAGRAGIAVRALGRLELRGLEAGEPKTRKAPAGKAHR